MNCKLGDLAMLVNALNPAMKQYAGSIRTVVRLSDVHDDAWYLEPPVYGRNGLRASWKDKDLRPIRDNPGNESFVTEARKSLPAPLERAKPAEVEA